MKEVLVANLEQSLLVQDIVIELSEMSLILTFVGEVVVDLADLLDLIAELIFGFRPEDRHLRAVVGSLDFQVRLDAQILVIVVHHLDSLVPVDRRQTGRRDFVSEFVLGLLPRPISHNVFLFI